MNSVNRIIKHRAEVALKSAARQLVYDEQHFGIYSLAAARSFEKLVEAANLFAPSLAIEPPQPEVDERAECCVPGCIELAESGAVCYDHFSPFDTL